jgi:hypothetical protein
VFQLDQVLDDLACRVEGSDAPLGLIGQLVDLAISGWAAAANLALPRYFDRSTARTTRGLIHKRKTPLNALR